MKHRSTALSPSSPSQSVTTIPTPIVIDNANEIESACRRFRRCRMVAVDCEGSDLGRGGTLTLVQVASDACVSVRCVALLGAAVFDRGLRALFEDSRVLKVLHDCRRDADALLHLYNVRVRGVFDTQVAFAVLARREGAQTPLPSSLNTVLRRYARGAVNAFKTVLVVPFALSVLLMSVGL